MAQPARGRRANGADPFPWVVCLVGIGIGLTILFRTTIPALAERRELESIEQRVRLDADDAERARRQLSARQERLERDPETVLVELDRLGIDARQLPPAAAEPADAQAAPR